MNRPRVFAAPRFLTAAFLVMALGAQAQEAQLGDTHARFEGATSRYGHDVLGGLPEWGRLCLLHDGVGHCITLPETSVFEDISPRLADTNGDGVAEAFVVESAVTGGASLAVYFLNKDGLTRVATPPIGQRNRWLAPIGIADFNGDGLIDVAYVETPHLGRVLKFWTVDGASLRFIGQLQGYSNHRIGEDFITSGVRDCGDGPEVVLPDSARARIKAVRLSGQGAVVTDLGAYRSRRQLERLLNC